MNTFNMCPKKKKKKNLTSLGILIVRDHLSEDTKKILHTTEYA